MKANKKINFLIYTLSLIFFIGILGSCSNKNCLYSHEKYRKKSSVTKGRTQNKPGKVKHYSPVRKKYILGNQKRNILGNR